MDISKIIEKARSSSFYLWVLNIGLARMVPFNKPHGFKVEEIKGNNIKISLPFNKRNINHIKGLHACALATLAEFTTGFAIISRLDPAKFRIILKRLEMDYHYQGKMKAFGNFAISDQWLNEKIYKPLSDNQDTVVPCEIKIYDADGNHLSTGNVHWQIKSWDKVKTVL